MDRTSRAVWLALAAVAAALTTVSSAAPVKQPHVEAELLCESVTVQTGHPFTVALRLKTDPHWHTYWRNPGDSGQTTSIDWKLAEGFKAGPIQWPYPSRLPVDTLVNYGYEDTVLLLTEITPPAKLDPGARIQISAHASWLVCADICVPGDADLELTMSTTAETPVKDERWAKEFAAARASLPAREVPWHFSAQKTDDGYRLVADPAQANAAWSPDAYFFASDPAVIEPSKPQPVTAEGAKRIVLLTGSQYAQGAVSRLKGVWVTPVKWEPGIEAALIDIPVDTPAVAAATISGPSSPGTQNLTVATQPVPAPDSSPVALIGVVLTALIGGLILNLMPCVFPVLSLKILGFVQQAGDDRAKVARHGWMFTLGVLMSFWSLAGALLVMRAGGSQLGWGYQLQSPPFVLGLCLLLFTLSLSLLGVFEIGGGLMNAAGRVETSSGLGGAFLNGALATLLATPCTAPFMGTALAFALTCPPIQALIVFTALGLGMAAPYLILSLRPAWLKFLPRPGAWMDTFKQLMAFPLLGTIIWLLWVFGFQTGVDGMMRGLAALLILALALWIWGRWGSIMRSTRVRSIAAVTAVALGIISVALGWNASNQKNSGGSLPMGSGKLAWEPFSPERLHQALAEGKPVFIDFSAAWCASCIVNERVVIDTAQIQEGFKTKQVVMLKADWTRRDPVITQALAGYGKSAVPLHVLYDGKSSSPTLVRELVTKSELADSIQALSNPVK